jgi:hypothetical protein
VPMWCVAPLVMNEGNSLGQGYNRSTGCSAEMAPHVTFSFVVHVLCNVLFFKYSVLRIASEFVYSTVAV